MTFWTDERITEMRQAAATGFAASEFAAEMGVTRNAVLGAAHRYGVQFDSYSHKNTRGADRPKAPRKPRLPTRRTPFRARPAFTTPQPEPSPAPAAAQSSAHWCELIDLTNETCRFPVNDQAPIMFCGTPEADNANGVPYCRFHMAIAFRRPGERERT